MSGRRETGDAVRRARSGWSAILAVLAILTTTVVAGCLGRAEREDETRPVVSMDLTMDVRVERYSCACAGDPHVHAVLRARHHRGKDAGLTAWVQNLDGLSYDSPSERDLHGPAHVEIVKAEVGDVVVVSGKDFERRYRLDDGTQVHGRKAGAKGIAPIGGGGRGAGTGPAQPSPTTRTAAPART